MIAMTNKNGKSVRLTADYHLDTETVYYRVYCAGITFELDHFRCAGITFEFDHFRPAAKVYNTLSRRIESGNFTDTCLKNLVAAARAMGYSVKEVA